METTWGSHPHRWAIRWKIALQVILAMQSTCPPSPAIVSWLSIVAAQNARSTRTAPTVTWENRAPKDWQLWSLGDVPGFSNVLGLFQVIMAKLEMGIFSAKLLKNQGEIGFQSGMNLEGVTFETYSTTCDFFIEDLDMICQFFQKFLVLSEDLTVSI